MPRPFSREKEKQILRRIWDLHYHASIAKEIYMQQYQASMKLYYDSVLTEHEKRLIQSRGQSDVSVNFLRILLKDLQAFLTSSQPQWQAYAARDSALRKSKLSNAVLGHNWRASKAYLQVSDIIKRGVVAGIGLFSNYIDYQYNNGEGAVKIKSIPFEYFYPDWRSQDPLYEDMSFQQVAYTVTQQTAIRMFPDRAQDIIKLSAEPHNYDTLFREGTLTLGQFPDPTEITRVRIISHYQLEEQDVYELEDMVTGERFRMNENPDIPTYLGISVNKITIPTLTKYDCIYGSGDDDGIIVDVTRFPFSDFLITPFIDEWTGNPYGLGEAYFLEKYQKYIDKMLRVALQNEQWNSNPGVFIPKNSVDNIAEFEKKALLPGFTLEVDMEYGTPVFKQGGASNNGLFNIMQFMIQSMRSSMGNMFTPEMSKGNAKEAQLLIQQGLQHGSMIFRNFQASLEKAGSVNLKLSKFFYKEPMLLKFLDERKRPTAVAINVPQFNEETGEEEIVTLEDIETDVHISIKSMSPSQGAEMAEKITAVMPYASPEVLDILFLELSKALELDPDTIDEMEARLQILPQLMQQMQAMQQTVEQLQKENEALQDQVFTADRKAVRSEYAAELEKQVNKFKTELNSLKTIYQNILKVKQQKGATNGTTQSR
jgi:hypothetical protein